VLLETSGYYIDDTYGEGFVPSISLWDIHGKNLAVHPYEGSIKPYSEYPYLFLRLERNGIKIPETI
jgi:hypothetical protein